MRPRIRHVFASTAVLAVLIALSWVVPATAGPAPSITAPASSQTVTNQPPSISWDTNDPSPDTAVVVYRGSTCGPWAQVTAATGEKGAYQEPPTLPNGTYCYKISATYSNLGPPPVDSNTVVITYDTVPPATPGAPAAAALYTSGAPTIVWPAPASKDVTGYNVYRNGQLVAGPLTGTSFTDISAPDGAYAYTVDAVDAAGNHSGLSAPANIVHDTGPPFAPRGVVPTVTGGAINLTWGGASDSLSPIAGYVVRRSAAGGSAPTTATAGTAVCTTTGTQSCTDPAPGKGSTFTYSVFAVDAAGNISSAAVSPAVSINGGVVLATVPDHTPTGPPRRASAKVHGSKVRLTWTDPTARDFDHVLVVVNHKHRPRSGTDGTRAYSGPRQSVILKVPPGTVLHYAVFAYDHSGNVSRAAFVDIHIPAAGPLSPVDGAVVSGTARLSWRPLKGTVYYNVQLYQGHTRVATAWPRTSSWVVPTSKLKKGQTYTWYVWPGVGPKIAGRYGTLIGKASFTYAGG
jgi:hypothetical protein